MLIGDVVGEVVLLAIFLLDAQVLASIGVTAAIAVLVALPVANVASNLFFANQLRPRAVRAEPDGIEVQPLFGAARTLPWSSCRLPAPGRRTRFESLLYRVGASPGFSTYVVTAEQSIALRSSPYRPSAWPATGPWSPTSSTS